MQGKWLTVAPWLCVVILTNGVGLFIKSRCCLGTWAFWCEFKATADDLHKDEPRSENYSEKPLSVLMGVRLWINNYPNTVSNLVDLNLSAVTESPGECWQSWQATEEHITAQPWWGLCLSERSSTSLNTALRTFHAGVTQEEIRWNTKSFPLIDFPVSSSSTSYLSRCLSALLPHFPIPFFFFFFWRTSSPVVLHSLPFFFQIREALARLA